MGRIFYFFTLAFFFLNTSAFAAVSPMRPSNYVNPASYAYMYPYLSNKMRTELNPGTTVSMTNNPIDVIVKTERLSAPRRVVARPQTSTARSATPTTTATKVSNSARRVVPRAAKTTTARSVVPRATRQNTGRSAPTNARTDADGNDVAAISPYTVSTTRCLAGYIECMDSYCAHEDTAYNRCYCSAKLAQIDSKYQDQLNDMAIQIIRLQGGGTWTDEEMNEYWMERIGQYVGENSWTNLDNALNIQWPTPEERIRGQQVFLTGHEYCVAHLKNCASMASNMRDAYRSQISRDCNNYEQGLMRIQTAAAAMIEYYSE